MTRPGYWPCCNEVVAAFLKNPHQYQPFAEYFDIEKLDAVREKYGADLYEECYRDVLARATRLWNCVTQLSASGVTCKPIFTPDDCHDDFIAVFGLGDLTKPMVIEIIKRNETYCTFQC